MGRPRKYRHVWEEIAHLEADHVKAWGAFDGYHGPVSFTVGGVAGARLEHDAASDRVSLLYTIGGDVKRGEFGLWRRASPLGGERVLFVAPCCNKRCVRLALLSEGVRCWRCGSVTSASRRSSSAQRAVRRAEQTAAELGLSVWSDPPAKRPGNMHPTRYAKVAADHLANVAKAQRLLEPKLRRLARYGANADQCQALAALSL